MSPRGAWLTWRKLWALCAACCFGCQPHTNASLSSEAKSQRCAACHLAEYQSVSRPPHAGVRPTTCGVCHLETAWYPYRLQHSWPLEGAHARTDCFACHRGQPRQFEGTPRACLGCHVKDDEKANATVAKHAQFPPTCETCHGTSAWKPTLPHGSPAPEAVPLEPVPIASPGVAGAASIAPSAGRKAPAAPRAKPTVRRNPDTVTGASPPWHP